MIEVRNLCKTYDDIVAVDHIDFEINMGEFYALLGSNGAGKTTTIGMLSTLLLSTSGDIFIEGERLTRKNKDIKKKISVVTQEYSMRQDMTMDEVMEYQGRLYFIPSKERKARTDELFEFAGLKKHRLKTVRQLSGGMKRKLMVCRALLTRPKILLLDEPTAGMDALARRQMWSLLKELNAKGLTILLTTHYIEEAQMLCDRVAFLKKGKIEAVDTPKAFIERLGVVALDENDENGMHTSFFATKEEAIMALEKSDKQCTLRDTTLEDVFVEMIDEHENTLKASNNSKELKASNNSKELKASNVSEKSKASKELNHSSRKDGK